MTKTKKGHGNWVNVNQLEKWNLTKFEW